MNSIKQFFINLANKIASAFGTTVYILGLILGLVAAFFYERDKKSAAEAILKNGAMDKKVNADNTDISKDQGSIEAQQQVQQNIQNEIKQQEAKQDSLQDITKLINGQ